MSGLKRLVTTLSGSEVAVDEPDKLGYFINRLLVPLVRQLLASVNRLSGESLAVAKATVLTGSEGLVLADATGGAFAVTLSAPTALFHLLIVQKVDATVNPVTVTAPAGFTVNGASSVILAAQWDRVLLVADDSAFYF